MIILFSLQTNMSTSSARETDGLQCPRSAYNDLGLSALANLHHDVVLLINITS